MIHCICLEAIVKTEEDVAKGDGPPYFHPMAAPTAISPAGSGSPKSFPTLYFPKQTTCTGARENDAI